MSKWKGVSVRLPPELNQSFRKRAELMGETTSSMLVTLIRAFVEGRVTIRENPDTKELKQELYQ